MSKGTINFGDGSLTQFPVLRIEAIYELRDFQNNNYCKGVILA